MPLVCCAHGSEVLNKGSLEAFDAFVDIYHRRLEEHDRKRSELRAKIEVSPHLCAALFARRV